jgi:hypothetical protein
MSYDFKGFFASISRDKDRLRLLADAKQQWPEARVRAIEQPFAGIGVGLVLSQYEPLAKNPTALRQAFQRFISWTSRHPRIAFVWIAACCIPVGCEYRGQAIRNGRILATEDGDGALGRLVAHLGVKLGPDEYFEPFTRGYFER